QLPRPECALEGAGSGARQRRHEEAALSLRARHERALHPVQSGPLDAADPPGPARRPLAGAARVLMVGRDPARVCHGRARQPGAPGPVPRRAERSARSEPPGPATHPLTLWTESQDVATAAPGWTCGGERRVLAALQEVRGCREGAERQALRAAD